MKEFHLAVTRLDCRKVLSMLRDLARSMSDTVDSRTDNMVNWRDGSLRTATMLLARRPSSDCRCRSHVRRSMLDVLRDAGAQLDLVDDDGNTALMHAVLSSSEDVVDWLLEAGVDAKIANHVGVTPLWQVIHVNRQNCIGRR